MIYDAKKAQKDIEENQETWKPLINMLLIGLLGIIIGIIISLLMIAIMPIKLNSAWGGIILLVFPLLFMYIFLSLQNRIHPQWKYLKEKTFRGNSVCFWLDKDEQLNYNLIENCAEGNKHLLNLKSDYVLIKLGGFKRLNLQVTNCDFDIIATASKQIVNVEFSYKYFAHPRVIIKDRNGNKCKIGIKELIRSKMLRSQGDLPLIISSIITKGCEHEKEKKLLSDQFTDKNDKLEIKSVDDARLLAFCRLVEMGQKNEN